MITAEDLDRLCVITYKIVQGDTHGFTDEDWDFISEVSVHAEDVIASSYNEEETDPDLNDWDEPLIEDYPVEDEYELD